MANMQFHHWQQNLSKGLGSPDLAVATLASCQDYLRSFLLSISFLFLDFLQQSPHSSTLLLLKQFGFHPWAPPRGRGL